MDPRVGEMVARYGSDLPDQLPVSLVAVGAAGGLAYAIRRTGRPALARLGAAGALAVGLALAWRQLAVFDDAFISFRYAVNLAEGRGLVWNAGEYVQGFTNPLWTLGIALGHLVIPGSAPYVALAWNAVSFVANLAVVYAIGRRVQAASGFGPFVPVAAMLAAVQTTVTAYASSGLETMLASLLVNLSLLALVTRDDARGALLAGLAAGASTLARPDHLLFHGAAGLVVLVRVAPGLWAARRDRAAWWGAGLDRIIAVAAPVGLYAGWLAFSTWYYGDILPNTYYTKSANLWYPSNGLVYSLSFWLASHLWLVLPWLGWWAARRSRSSTERDLKVFVLAALAVDQTYIVKVGGDFMFGRFFVALIPLVLLGCEALWHDLADRRSRIAPAMLVSLLVTAVGGRLYSSDWWISDENANYKVERLYPLVIDHNSFKDAQALRPLGQVGLKPTIGTCCIGMIGYYVDTEVIDYRGLTDRRVARMPVKKRGMPGHEKWAPDRYVRKRGVRISRHKSHPEPYDDLTRLSIRRAGPQRDWRIVAYDRELMAEIRRRIPQYRFEDFDRHLEAYLGRIDQLDAAQIEADLAFFDRYWFDHNADGARRQRIVAALEAARARQAPAPP